MQRTGRFGTAVTAVTLTALAALGGCGDGDGDGGGEASPSPAQTDTASPTATASPTGSPTGSPAGAATVQLRSADDLGKILTDGEGRTLYLFEADTAGKSTCFDACAEAWPPLTTSGEPKAGKEADAALLGTTERQDGSTQVTYDGHPLYTYQGDEKPGDTTGQGLNTFGGEWLVMNASGEKVENGGRDEGPQEQDGEENGDTGGGY